MNLRKNNEFKNFFIYFSISTSLLYILASVIVFTSYTLFTLFILIYAFVAPFSSVIKHKHIYFIVLPAPFLGLLYIFLSILFSFNLPYLPTIYLSGLITSIIINVLHYFTRMRYVIAKNILISSFTRILLASSSSAFLVYIVLILYAQILVFDILTIIIPLLFLSGVYCLTSILYVNSAWRCRIVCKLLGSSRLENRINFIRNKLGEKFLDRKPDVDLLIYYFSEAVQMFIEGDFERAFMTGYTCIRDETVVNPTELVSDKRGEGELSFSDIRSCLVHFKRKKLEITPKNIMSIRSAMPWYTFELLERILEFLNKLVSD